LPSVFFCRPKVMPGGIGTKKETSLHRELKSVYAGEGGRTEVEAAGFVVDAVDAEGTYVEVQTGSFGPLRRKAGELAALGRLKIVRPVAVAKYLEFCDENGRELRLRKSNRAGKIWDLFAGLLYAPELPLVPGLEIELAMVDVAERRIPDGKGSWRRKGVSVGDRRLLAFHGGKRLATPADYLCFVPFAKNEEFTSDELGARAKIRIAQARKALYVLVRLGVVETTGKRGNRLLYRPRVTAKTKKWKKLPKMPRE